MKKVNRSIAISDNHLTAIRDCVCQSNRVSVEGVVIVDKTILRISHIFFWLLRLKFVTMLCLAIEDCYVVKCIMGGTVHVQDITALTVEVKNSET